MDTEASSKDLAQQALEARVPPTEEPSSQAPTSSLPPDTAPGPAPSKSPVKEYIQKNLGIELDPNLTDEQLAPQIAEILAHQQRLADEYRRAQEELQQRDAMLAQYADSRPSAEPQEGTVPRGNQAQQPDPTKPLKLDRDWLQAAELDPDSGRWVPKAKFGVWGVQAANNLNEYVRQQNERSEKLLSDPWNYALETGGKSYLEEFEKKIKEEVDQRVQQVAQGLMYQAEQTRMGDQFEAYFQQNADQYFETVNGQPRIQNGQPVLNEKGKRFQNAVKEAREMYGMDDPSRIYHYAWKEAERDYPAQRPVEPKTPQQVQEDRDLFISNVDQPVRHTNRDNTVVAAAARDDAQTRGLSFSELMRQELAEQGLNTNDVFAQE